MKSGKILLGLLAGIAGGAVLGILFAPAKGSKTRSQIQKKGDDYADSLKEKYNTSVKNVSNKFEDGKIETEEFIAKQKNRFDDLKES